MFVDVLKSAQNMHFFNPIARYKGNKKFSMMIHVGALKNPHMYFWANNALYCTVQSEEFLDLCKDSLMRFLVLF
jgi:hypothetical protein